MHLKNMLCVYYGEQTYFPTPESVIFYWSVAGVGGGKDDFDLEQLIPDEKRRKMSSELRGKLENIENDSGGNDYQQRNGDQVVDSDDELLAATTAATKSVPIQVERKFREKIQESSSFWENVQLMARMKEQMEEYALAKQVEDEEPSEGELEEPSPVLIRRRFNSCISPKGEEAIKRPVPGGSGVTAGRLLQVVVLDRYSNRVEARIKSTGPLSKLFQAFQSKALDEVGFCFM